MRQDVGERVECRAEAAYPGRPLAFTFQGQRCEVADVLKNWRSPDGKRYQVTTGDGRVFELSYNEACDEWSVREL